MRDFRDAKAMAQTLRDALKIKSISVSHSESLELVAKTLGFHDWNVLSAAIQSSLPIEALPGKASARSPGTVVPIAPMRDIVFFPQLITPIFVGREKTRRAIEHAARSDGRLLVVTQKRPEDDNPGFDALHSVGVIAEIIRSVEAPQGNMRVKVSCTERAAIARRVDGEFLSAEVATIEETRALDPEAFIRAREIFETYESFAHSAPPQSLRRYAREPGVLADVLVQLMDVGIDRMQQILETGDVVARLEIILGWMCEVPPGKAS